MILLFLAWFVLISCIKSRHCTSPDSKKEKELRTDSSRSKCLPKTIKIMSNKQSRNATMRSPTSEAPRTSSAMLDSSKSSPLCSSKAGSSRIITDASSQKGSSMRLESFKEHNDKVIKIEES